jgi:hypothetical protein
VETPVFFYFILHCLKFFWPVPKVFGKPRGPHANKVTLSFFPVERLGLRKRDFFKLTCVSFILAIFCNFPIGILSPKTCFLTQPNPTQPTPTDGVVPLSEIGKLFISLMSYTFFLELNN